MVPPDQTPSGTTATWNQPPNNPPAATCPPAADQLPPKPHQHNHSITDAISSIKPADFLTVHQAPCSRHGFLVGLSSGFAFGGLRFILGLPFPKAANWAVASGVLAALASYEYCQHRRMQEKAHLARLVRVFNNSQAAAAPRLEDAKKTRAEEWRSKGEEEARRRKRWWSAW